MNESQQLLSEIVTYTKYARYREDLKRRETWEEIIDRYVGMMVRKYSGEPAYKQWLSKSVDAQKFPFAAEIIQKSQYLYRRDVLPSMRMLQFAGPAIEKNEARGYNCSYLPIDDYRAFSEVMFLLLGGTGVGYSVQNYHVEKLPTIQQPIGERKFLIGDSIEGWSDAIKALMKSYFGYTKHKPRFDYRDIRAKGEQLITAGGKAPGPEPLRICLTKIDSMLSQLENGHQLRPIECHDILCYIADAVLAGGIRRAAMISLFSQDDIEMATCKHGHWWELNPQRGRANNSIVLNRNKINKEDYLKLWKTIKDSNSGEPGIYWNDGDHRYGTNPCAEISLREFSFCNLTEINAGTVRDQEDLNERSTVASFFGTLQAGFTDFHYLRPIWKRNTEKDSLIGVGITGIGNGNLVNLDLTESSTFVMRENDRLSKEIGINNAARTTTIKPSGTTSCVVGTSSGIHAWHSKHYVRNMQCTVGDDLYNYFSENHPDMIKVMDYQPGSAVIGCPMEAPETAMLRETESAIDFLERVKKYNLKWVREGHRRGPNFNNVSATCNIREDEWVEVGKWMWENKNNYSGISVLPYDNGSYMDAPFQVCTLEEYEERMDRLRSNPIELTKIVEDMDNTDLKGEIACAGGVCELIF